MINFDQFLEDPLNVAVLSFLPVTASAPGFIGHMANEIKDMGLPCSASDVRRIIVKARRMGLQVVYKANSSCARWCPTLDQRKALTRRYDVLFSILDSSR